MRVVVFNCFSLIFLLLDFSMLKFKNNLIKIENETFRASKP